MNPKASQRNTAVTLTELLVVLVIISILSTIALPVYISNAEKARISASEEEVLLIGEAMERCGILHGYYVPIQLLNDIRTEFGMSTTALETDALDLEDTSITLIDPSVSIQLLDTPTGNPTLTLSSENQRIVDLYNDWEGPFINFQRIDDAEDITDISDRVPLDPWRRPYRFYSPLGLVGSGASDTDPIIGFSDGQVTNIDPRFDRYAIVSFGPDGASDSLTGNTLSPDDIIYTFGKVRSESVIN